MQRVVVTLLEAVPYPYSQEYISNEMPRRRLISNGQNGYNVESQFNAVMRMSEAAMWSTNVKNEREKFLLRRNVAQIADDKRDAIYSMNRVLGGLRRELMDFRVYRRVYNKNNFKNWERSNKRSQIQGTVDPLSKTEGEVGLESSHHSNFEKQGIPEVLPRQHVHKLPCDDDPNTSNTIQTHRPQEGEERGRFYSLFPPMPEGTIGNAVNNTLEAKNIPSVPESFQKNIANASKSHAKTTALVNVSKPNLRARESRKVSTFLPPGCKGVFFIHRYMEKEAEEVIREMDPSNLRKKRIEKLMKTVKMPVVINNKRSTSDIMQEFSYRQHSSSNSKRDG